MQIWSIDIEKMKEYLCVNANLNDENERIFICDNANLNDENERIFMR